MLAKIIKFSLKSEYKKKTKNLNFRTKNRFTFLSIKKNDLLKIRPFRKEKLNR